MSVCVYCGAEIRLIDETREHVLPKAVLKWGTFDDVEVSGFNKRGVNVFPAHKICNENKAGKVLTESQIRSLFVSDVDRERILAFHREIKSLSDSYLRLRERIYWLQNGRCFECGDELNSNFSLRRPIHRLPRSINNCVGLCMYCTDEFHKVRDKYDRKGIKYVKRQKMRFRG